MATLRDLASAKDEESQGLLDPRLKASVERRKQQADLAQAKAMEIDS